MLALAVLGGVSACSTFNWRQSLYDIRDQHACQEANEARHGPGGAALECTNADHPDRTRYGDYERRRKRTMNTTEDGDV